MRAHCRALGMVWRTNQVDSRMGFVAAAQLARLDLLLLVLLLVLLVLVVAR